MKRLLLIALLALSSPALADTVAGKYQAVLGDCEGCHGKNLAGGIALDTPFGKLVTPNITPDRDTGVGNYTADDFRKAMKQGVAPGGKRLYPAMPYPYYARMTDGDVAQLWAYIRTVKPVRNAVTVNQLRFPFNLRVLMAGWNALFFKIVFTTPSNVSQEWIRGEYLVKGPAHCGACHSPKNLFGADTTPTLSGALLQGWFAPNLSGDRASGLGGWSSAEVIEYLKTGRNAHSIASGPMAEAVENSTSKMDDADLMAVAFYLKSLSAGAGNGGSGAGAVAQMQSGMGVYRINCAACHGLDGKGSALFPPLAGNANVTQAGAETPARMVVMGSRAVATKLAPTGPGMPSLGWKLDDAQTANVLTYIRNSWGNSAPAVDAGVVQRVRASK